MEMKNEQSELISAGKHPLSAVEGEAAEIKCVKRRRRDTSAVALGGNEQQGEQRQLQPQADQSTTATAAKRSSRFRGVSRHRWTGRFEAHLWDKGSWNPTQRKKGKQVYLGAYDEEESAARAYDLAALKYWGTSTFTNFPIADYEKELEIMKTATKEEYLASLRRRSSGFSRGVSKYRGVARHHHNGRWEARIGRVFGNKYLYLGTYSTQEEAAHAYDIAAIEYRGINAVTNFDLNTYIRWLRPGANSLVSQEPTKSSPGCRLIPSSSNHIPNQETELSFFPINPFAASDLSIPQKPEIFRRETQTPISPKPSSSPSALGLLLRSSVFKELVERNLNVTEGETEENDTKNAPEFGNLYDEIGSFPNYMCSASGDVLPGLESREENNALPLYNRTGHSLWSTGHISLSS